MRAEGGRFDPERALWRSWWEGQPVRPARVRAQLLAAVDDYASLAAWMASAEAPGHLLARLQRTPGRELPAPLQALRRHKDRVAAVDALLRVFAGGFGGWSYEGERAAFARATGLDRAGRDRIGTAAPWLRGLLSDPLADLSTKAAPAELRSALDGTADAGLDDARDELQALAGVLFSLAATLEGMRGRGAFGLGAVGDPREWGVPLQRLLLAAWLALRRHPELQDGYRTLLAASAFVAPPEEFASLVRGTGAGESPRRQQPAGGALDGEEPTRARRT
jgi:hypothetical protein